MTENSAVGFYAINGESVVTFTEAETKERICGVLELVREQNPGRRILSSWTSTVGISVNTSAGELIDSGSIPFFSRQVRRS